MKIKKGDEVKIIKGKDKGKSGKVDAVFVSKQKVMILGVNEYKRHKKGKGDGKPSEIISITKPLSWNNVQIVCSKCHLPTRIGFSEDNGKKIRICKKCQQAI